VVVVDSETSWLGFSKTVFQKHGYETYTVSSGKAALEVLSKKPDPALILLDIGSFEMAKKAVISALTQTGRQRRRSVVVLFPLGMDSEKVRRAFKQGVTDCVEKPYNETALLALTEQVFAEHRVNSTAPRETAQLTRVGRILVVDDDRDWLDNLVTYLPPADEITEASDYMTARREIIENCFELAILDLRLVDVDERNFQGMDLLSLIRKRDAEREAFTQVIIVSAYGTSENIRESYRDFQIYYYFDKRLFSPLQYRETVKSLLIGEAPEF
jgi:DNA-binding NtrC family response regulator